jgi:hypothetical protein
MTPKGKKEKKPKKSKAQEPLILKHEDAELAMCANCGCEFMPDDTQKDDLSELFCSADCEIAFLRAENTRLAKVARKESDLQCYGRVDWATCAQEWYAMKSQDGKRRVHELKRLGFTSTSRRLDEMPVFNGDGELVMKKMSVLTCLLKEEDGELVHPPMPNLIAGLAEEEEDLIIEENL